MAKLIKSILANRMMFRGGGLVPPSQAAGILASSSPLIDSVAMNQGGLVNYANGGEITLGAAPAGLEQSVPTTYMDTAGVDGQLPGNLQNVPFEDVTTPITDTDPWWMKRAAGTRETIDPLIAAAAAGTRETIDPLIAAAAKIVAAAKEQQVNAVEAVVEGLNVAPEIAVGIVRKVEDLLSGITTNLAGEMPALEARSDVSVAEQLNGTSPITASVDSTVFDREGPTSFESVAEQVAAQTSVTSPEEYMIPRRPPRTTPSDGLSQADIDQINSEADSITIETAEGPNSSIALNAEKSVSDYVNDTLIGKSAQGGARVPLQSSLLDGELSLNDALQNNPFSKELGRGARSGAASARRKALENQGLLNPGQDLATAEAEWEEAATAAYRKEVYGSESGYLDAQEREEVFAEDRPSSVKKAEEAAKKKAKKKALEAAKKKAGAGAGAGAGEEALEAAKKEALEQYTDILQESAEDNSLQPEDMQGYIDEFVEAMPDYEGKSKYEKGMDIVKMGMAIAGGTSPHAIKNIADGVLATIDNFTDDEEAKREYNREVKMAAAKYGLDYKKLNRTQEMKDMRDFKDFAFFKDWTDPETGREYKRGEGYQMNMKDMLAGKFETMPLVLPDYMEEILTGELALSGIRAEAEAEMLAGQVLDVSEYGALRESRVLHQDAIKDVRHGTVFVGYLRGLIGNEEQLTGLRGWMQGKAQQIANFTGTYNQLNELLESQDLTPDVRNRYQLQLTEVSNNMLRELLGEASKNISNVDRKLAREIIGLFTDSELAVMSPETLNQRLNNSLSKIEAMVVDGWHTIDEQENLWVDKYVAGSDKPAAATFLGRRKAHGLGDETFREVSTEISPVSPLSGPIDRETGEAEKYTYSWADIFDEKTGTFNWSGD